MASNPVNGAAVTFLAPGSGASGTFSNGTATITVNTNASGLATATFTANGTSGGYTVTAKAGAIGPANFLLTNNAGSAANIAATAGTPQNTTISTAFATALQATVTDSGGNLLNGAAVTFLAPGSGASGTFSNGTATITVNTNASGVATATFTANSVAGGYTVTAKAGAIGPANFSLTNNAGAAANIAATAGTPQNTTISTAFATALQATVSDSSGNLLNGVAVTFLAPGSGASGTFSNGTATITVNTNASGLATATFTANGVAGGYTVTAKAGAIGPANFLLTNNAGAAANIAATAGTPQNATISTAFATALQATVTDASSNPVNGAAVTFLAPGSGASGTFSNGTATITVNTNSSGLATATYTANGTAGGYTVTAKAGAIGPANFLLTNNAGPAANIAATAGTPQNTTISTAFATALQAKVTDSGGNLLNGVAVTFLAPGSGASGTFSNGTATITVNTNASGVASATFTANTVAGAYTVTAKAGAIGPANFSLTNNAGAAASIAATAGTPQSAPVSTAYGTALKAIVKDASGNVVSGVTITFTAPASGASGTFAGVNTATTDATGVATAATFTANATGGAFTVNASVAGVATPAPYLLTNVSFTLTLASPGTVQITGGSPANVQLNLTITPTGSPLPTAVNYACMVPAELTGTTCAMNPASTAAGATTGQTTLMITTAASVPSAPGRKDPPATFLLWLMTAALAGLLGIYFAGRQKLLPWRVRPAFLALGLLVIAAGATVGCTTAGLFTPKGPATINVTATSGGAVTSTQVNINVN